MPAQMRGKRIGVEKLGQATQTSSFLAMPEDASSTGVVKYVGDGLKESDLKVGMKVSFGGKREQVRIEGADIQVMDEDNVYAILD